MKINDKINYESCLVKGKRIDNEEWVQGNLIWSNDAENGYEAIIIPTTNSGMYARPDDTGDLGFEKWYRVDPSTLCRCTGSRDKNGELIWENDIVKFTVYNYEKALTPIVSNVQWCDEIWAFSIVVNTKGNRGTLGHILQSNKEAEVIGNKFENPELTKVKTDNVEDKIMNDIEI